MQTIPTNDKIIIRELAKQYAEAAALPVMAERKHLWKQLNGLKPARPMIAIDQVCWCEMEVDDELTLRCENDECRAYEESLRKALYQHKHMPVDQVIEPFIPVAKAITGLGFGIDSREETLASDEKNDVLSRRFENQFTCMVDIEKITMPVIGHDTAETARREAVATELFDGILDIRLMGAEPWITIWDPISMWMGVENALFAFADEPELMHALAGRMIAVYESTINQLEGQELLRPPQSLIHCTGAWTDELPATGYDPDKVRLKDLWGCGLAQMMGACSPAMFEEFELEYCLPLFKRFGLLYYGCCDSLDGKLDLVKKIPNVRKISASPWSTQESFAEQIGSGYVFSRKPNPALLATHDFDAALVRADLMQTKAICEKNDSPLEFILKDISTVRYQPERLWEWARIAAEVVED